MKIISFSSGKGGVGKTSITSNVALGLSQLGHRVLILDGDLGMANVDIFFGVHPKKNISDLLQGLPLNECITSVSQNIDLLAGGSGVYELSYMNSFQRREVISRLEAANYQYDFLLIDTSPGLHDHVLHLNAVADDCHIVLTPDPSSFADSYALIKVLQQKYKTQKFSIICNQVKDEAQGAQLFLRFADVVQQFLSVRIQYKGSIPYDVNLKISNQNQRLIMRQDPRSISTQAIRVICAEIDNQYKSSSSLSAKAKGLDSIFRPVSGHA